jgi:hypothetical protein
MNVTESRTLGEAGEKSKAAFTFGMTGAGAATLIVRVACD